MNKFEFDSACRLVEEAVDFPSEPVSVPLLLGFPSEPVSVPLLLGFHSLAAEGFELKGGLLEG